MRSGSQKIRVSRGRVPVGDGSAPGAGGCIEARYWRRHQSRALGDASRPGADGNIEARRWWMAVEHRVRHGTSMMDMEGN